MSIVRADIIYIPVENLSVVWVQSQRPYNERWAREIADDFDPDKFEPLIVTKPNGDGMYHIIEGQHRRHALEMYAAKANPSGYGNKEQAPCRVVAEADPARAAEIWLGVNGGRKAVKPIHGFRVAVVAGRETEVAIEQIVRMNGFQVGSEKKSGCISAVRALKTIFDRHGPTVLSSTLKTVRQMWHGDPNSLSSPMLRGFGLFMSEFGTHVDPKRMMKVSEKWSPFKLHQAADAHKQSTTETIDVAIAWLLFREYNKGMKEGAKLRRKD